MKDVLLVPTQHVFQCWKDVEGYLSDALAFAQGDFTIEQLKADLGQGRAALYVVVDTKVIGAIAVNFQNRHNSRVAFVLAIGGNWIANDWGMEKFTAVLKKAGVTHIEGVGRDSIVRLWRRFGFKKKYTVFDVAI